MVLISDSKTGSPPKSSTRGTVTVSHVTDHSQFSKFYYYYYYYRYYCYRNYVVLYCGSYYR